MFNKIANMLDWWTISKLTVIVILKHDSLNFTFHCIINQNLTLFEILYKLVKNMFSPMSFFIDIMLI